MESPFLTTTSRLQKNMKRFRNELVSTIDEATDLQISQEEMELLLNSLSPIIQKQVSKYVKELIDLNRSINYNNNNNLYYPSSVSFTDYSPAMPNNSFQEPTFYGTYQTNSNKANPKRKRKNIKKSLYKKKVNYEKGTRNELIDETVEPIQNTAQNMFNNQDNISFNSNTNDVFNEPIQASEKKVPNISKESLHKAQSMSNNQNSNTFNSNTNSTFHKPTGTAGFSLASEKKAPSISKESLHKAQNMSNNQNSNTFNSNTNSTFNKPKQTAGFSLPVPQEPTYTVESFNNLPISKQQLAISNIIQKTPPTELRNSISILNDSIKSFLEVNPNSEEKYFSIITKDNQMPLKEGLKNIDQIRVSQKFAETLQPQIDSPENISFIREFKQLLFDLEYPSQNFETIYKNLTNLKQKEPNRILISILYKKPNKTDDRFKNDVNIYSVKFDSTVTEISGGTFSIGSNAGGSFSGCSSLEEVILPNSINMIGDFAFYKCTSLKKISIPSSVNSIKNGVFWGCSSLTDVTIPSSVTSIGGHCFNGCKSLNHISIPQNVASIGPLCFNGCISLNEINIPPNVKSISTNCFKDCSSLIRINIPNSVTLIGENAFNGCSSLKEINIPDSVECINESAFCQCVSLLKISIPDSVKEISDNVFNGCKSLNDLKLGSHIDSIGKGAFLGCSSLKEIHVPSSVKSIGKGAFFGCLSLEKIIVPSGISTDGIGLNQGVKILTALEFVHPKTNIFRSSGKTPVWINSKSLDSPWSTAANVFPEKTASQICWGKK